MNKWRIIAAAGIAASGILSMSEPSNAAIVCNGDGDCWHSHETYTYPGDAQIVVHPDTWTWGSDAHFRWHEHEGRGYWGHGEWRMF